MALAVKNLLANEGDRRDRGSILGPEDPLEKEMATSSSVLAWKNPWTEEPGGLESTGLQSRTWLSTQHRENGICFFLWILTCRSSLLVIATVNTVRVKQSESLSVLSNSLQPHELYSPLNSPGQNTGVGSLSLLQGIFRTQGLSPGLPHCRQILYQLSYKGSPRILEWVAFPFFSGSSWPRHGTRVSCIAGGFFTNCTIREAQQ